MDSEGSEGELYSYDVEDFVLNMCKARKRQEVFEKRGRDLAVLYRRQTERAAPQDVQELQGRDEIIRSKIDSFENLDLSLYGLNFNSNSSNRGQETPPTTPTPVKKGNSSKVHCVASGQS